MTRGCLGWGCFDMGLLWFGVVLVWGCFGLGLFWFGVVLVWGCFGGVVLTGVVLTGVVSYCSPHKDANMKNKAKSFT